MYKIFLISLLFAAQLFAVETFTAAESAVLKTAEAGIFQQDGAIEAQLNRTKAEQKAFFVAQLDSQLTALQSGIDNIDAAVAAIKTAKLAEMNAKKTLLEGLKTKLQNLPE